MTRSATSMRLKEGALQIGTSVKETVTVGGPVVSMSLESAGVLVTLADHAMLVPYGNIRTIKLAPEPVAQKAGK